MAKAPQARSEAISESLPGPTRLVLPIRTAPPYRHRGVCRHRGTRRRGPEAERLDSFGTGSEQEQLRKGQAMTAYWGPGLDAEIAYRHEQVRAQFGRRHRFGRRRRTISNDVLPVGEPTVRSAPAIPGQRTGGSVVRSTRPSTAGSARRAA
jgi:hypothetical protein